MSLFGQNGLYSVSNFLKPNLPIASGIFDTFVDLENLRHSDSILARVRTSSYLPFLSAVSFISAISQDDFWFQRSLSRSSNATTTPVGPGYNDWYAVAAPGRHGLMS
jgi:hypothetical protein